MKKLLILLGFALFTSLAFSQNNVTKFKPGVETDADMQKLVNFLTSTEGVAYMGTARELNGRILPLSYHSTRAYWAEYVCFLNPKPDSCKVTNLYKDCVVKVKILGQDLLEINVCPVDHDHRFTPSGPFGKLDSKNNFEPKGGDLQVERVNVSAGSNIYDASTWQIALALASEHNLKPYNNAKPNPDDKKSPPAIDKKQSLAEMIDNQNLLLKLGFDGNAPEDPPQKGVVSNAPKNVIQYYSNRATTKNGVFLYNGKTVTLPSEAFHFRMVPRAWLSPDPFAKTDRKGDTNYFYEKYVKTEGTLPDDYVGKISWMDWKPIVGENAWAFFTGPLQAEYILYRKNKDSLQLQRMAIQNALPLLTTFSYMQSSVGGIYYAPQGSLGNVGDQPVNPYDISVENNASALSGFYIFEKLLETIRDTRSLGAEDNAKVKAALCRIDTIIYGGKTADGRDTQGLLKFFKDSAWSTEKGIFIQGGHADEPGKPKWVPKPISGPNKEDLAVDVSTWGIAAIGPKNLDSWKGFGTSYNAWKSVKTWGGYQQNGQLWGVGYSDKDNAGRNLIMSTEWTAGAINLVRMLIRYYEAVGMSNGPDAVKARSYLVELKNDESSMSRNILNLRTDKYPAVQAFGAPRDQFKQLVPIDSSKYLAYLYASKRYFIPFGWFANPLPSTTSIAWPIMLYYEFNPFSWQGTYESNVFKTDAERQKAPCGSISSSKKIKVKPDVKDALDIVISWCPKKFSECKGNDWTELTKIANPKPNMPLVEIEASPDNMKAFSVSYHKAGTDWFGACHLDLTKQTPEIKDLLAGKRDFVAKWSAPNGQGECGTELKK